MTHARVGRSYPAGSVAIHPPQKAGSAHRGASLTSKDLAQWYPAPGSADADLLPELGILVPRSRDLVRNNGMAAGAIQTQVDNVVGIGLRLSAVPNYRALGKDWQWAEEWSNQVEAAWQSWADTTECDAARSLNFAGLTTQVFRAGMTNGEAIALPVWLPDSRSQWSTRISLVEADRLSNPDHRMDEERLRGGIEIDTYGRPLAYWIQSAHPGDALGLLSFAALMAKWERIPAETAWGRKRVVHVHDKERTGQSRGKPLLTPILSEFKLLDHYRRTELQASIVNAMIAAFIKTPLDSQSIAQMFGGDPMSPAFQSYLTQRREYVAPLKGAAIIPIHPGDEVQPFMPARPAAAFGAFVENIAREMGAGIGLPYELLLKDFSKSNYSSARAALLEAWRFFRGRRQWLTTYWAQPIYELWLEEAVSSGRIEAPDFYEKRFAYCRAKWIGAGRGWIDPVKEAQAAQIRMDAGLSTLESECAEQGEDWQEVIEQRARERQRIAELEQKIGMPLLPSSRPAPAAEKTRDEDQEEQNS